MLKWGTSYWLAVLLSLGLVIFISLAIGLVNLRTGALFCDFFLVCLPYHNDYHPSLGQLNRGSAGFDQTSPINPIIIPGIEELSFTTMISQYYLFLAFLLFTLFIVQLIIDSRLGRAFQAVRLNEVLADSLGINVMATKMFSFTLSAFFAGLGG